MADPFFVHPHGIVESGVQIGAGTRIWAFAHILPGAVIGSDCNICDHVFIENNVIIGDRVTIKSGVQLWDGITLEDDVFIGPNVTFTNDHFPRSKHYPEAFPKTLIRRGASIGANATILPNVKVGQHAMVGAGAVVTHDVPPNAIVTGNPARVTGFVDASHQRPLTTIGDPGTPLKVTGARLVTLSSVIEPRGNISIAEVENQLPFTPLRYFVVFEVPSYEVRGQHAHRLEHEFLSCIHGSCHVVLDNGFERDEVILTSPQLGLHIPPMVWGIQYKYSPDSILLVLTSNIYNSTDYIRDYDEFLSLTDTRLK